MGKHHAVKNNTFQVDRKYVGKHRIKDDSFRITEVDMTGRDDAKRIFVLHRTLFGKKIFRVKNDGSYERQWGFEDTSEYWQKYGQFPPYILMLNHKDFLEYCERRLEGTH